MKPNIWRAIIMKAFATAMLWLETKSLLAIDAFLA
jgi:hypothetical protein